MTKKSGKKKEDVTFLGMLMSFLTGPTFMAETLHVFEVIERSKTPIRKLEHAEAESLEFKKITDKIASTALELDNLPSGESFKKKLIRYNFQNLLSQLERFQPR